LRQELILEGGNSFGLGVAGGFAFAQQQGELAQLGFEGRLGAFAIAQT
jgi:hypothetical protein